MSDDTERNLTLDDLELLDLFDALPTWIKKKPPTELGKTKKKSRWHRGK